MAKTPFPVNRNLLASCIQKVEQSGPFPNLSQLYKAVADAYNLTHPDKEITSSVVLLRIAEFGLTTKTKPGKKGRSSLSEEQKAAMQAARGKRVPRAEKFAKDPSILAGFEKQNQRTPERFLPVIKRAQAGSRTAMNKHMCLQCTNFQPLEIKHCTSNSCALYAVRPYQSKNGNATEDAEEIEEDEVFEEVA